MSSDTHGGPAFPCEFIQHKAGEVGNNVDIYAKSEGITIRDYFAAAAMQGICASGPTIGNGEISREAYQIADAMLKERNR